MDILDKMQAYADKTQQLQAERAAIMKSIEEPLAKIREQAEELSAQQSKNLIAFISNDLTMDFLMNTENYIKFSAWLWDSGRGNSEAQKAFYKFLAGDFDAGIVYSYGNFNEGCTEDGESYILYNLATFAKRNNRDVEKEKAFCERITPLFLAINKLYESNNSSAISLLGGHDSSNDGIGLTDDGKFVLRKHRYDTSVKFDTLWEAYDAFVVRENQLSLANNDDYGY